MFEITLSRGYSENSFRDDLKILYNKLGMENQKVSFLFTDQHVVEEGVILCELIVLELVVVDVRYLVDNTSTIN